VNPDPKGRPEPRDPMGKRWSPKGTPAGFQAFGSPDSVAPPTTPAEGTPVPGEEHARRSAFAVRESFPDEVIQIVHYRREWTAVVKPERILEIMRFLRDSHGWSMCHDVTAVDLYPGEPRFMVVYHLLDVEHTARLRVKCPVPGDKPEIDSVVGIWTGADYTEREAYDMMGITFRGHPDLRRILMPEDYEHYPLRKDFPLTGFPVGTDAVKD
jgi:NADH-quinone oxidoreductase subunit C